MPVSSNMMICLQSTRRKSKKEKRDKKEKRSKRKKNEYFEADGITTPSKEPATYKNEYFEADGITTPSKEPATYKMPVRICIDTVAMLLFWAFSQ